jgi:hypothetical protein
MVEAGGGDRAVLSEGWSERRATAISVERDAAHILPAAVVQSVGSGAEEALYDIQLMRAFCGLELGHDAIPDET